MHKAERLWKNVPTEHGWWHADDEAGKRCKTSKSTCVLGNAADLKLLKVQNSLIQKNLHIQDVHLCCEAMMMDVLQAITLVQSNGSNPNLPLSPSSTSMVWIKKSCKTGEKPQPHLSIHHPIQHQILSYLQEHLLVETSHPWTKFFIVTGHH